MSDQEDISVRFTVTPAEVDTWQNLTLKPKMPPFRTWIRGIVIGSYFAIAVLFTSLNPRHGTPASLPQAAWMASAAFLVVLPYSWFSDRYAHDIAIRKRSAEGEFAYLLSHRAITLTKQGIRVESDTDTVEYSWQKVHKLSFTTNGIIFFAFDGDKACIIPYTAFPTLIDAKNFYDSVMREYEANHSVTRSYTVSKTNLRPRL